MLEFKMMRHRSTAWLLAFLCASHLIASAQSTTSKSKPCNRFDSEYESVLDAYFIHVRGNIDSAIVLRIFGGLFPEYEIVFDPAVSKSALTRYSPSRIIWGKTYNLGGSHRSLAEYQRLAIEIPVVKQAFELPQEKLDELIRRAARVDTSICESAPFKDRKGHDTLILDAPWFELITNGGKTRARVTDTTGSDISSQNATLLQWALDVQRFVPPPDRAQVELNTPLHPNAHLTHLILDAYYSGLTFGGWEHTVIGRSWIYTDG
jgi:hypothetical protein